MDEKDCIEDIDEYCMYVHVSSTLHIQLISDYEKIYLSIKSHIHKKQYSTTFNPSAKHLISGTVKFCCTEIVPYLHCNKA